MLTNTSQLKRTEENITSYLTTSVRTNHNLNTTLTLNLKSHRENTRNTTESRRKKCEHALKIQQQEANDRERMLNGSFTAPKKRFEAQYTEANQTIQDIIQHLQRAAGNTPSFTRKNRRVEICRPMVAGIMSGHTMLYVLHWTE